MAQVSFEYFPPRSEAQQARFDAAHEQLKALKPEYYSVTFGAGGSTRDETAATVDRISAGAEVAPHISCKGGDEQQIDRLLDHYVSRGVRRLVVLRGDATSGAVGGDDFPFAADLVAHVRRRHGDHFHLAVACYPEVHPEARGAAADLRYFKAKVDAGADEAITQYFFNADAYFRFVDAARAAGINVPIVPGVMPITNYDQLKRFSNMCGAEIPRWLDRRLQDLADDTASIAELGLDVVSGLCEQLVDGGAPSLHIYTLNRAKATIRLVERIADAGPSPGSAA
ncbi:MAG: methylenetetrahydrofolate reductase [NAD(P)H] [Pseudomonadota bacterium]